jgi:hypothetical protein
MDKLEKIMLIGMLILIPLGAYLDLLLVGVHSFKQYLFICLWEYALFWTGIFVGERIKNRVN